MGAKHSKEETQKGNHLDIGDIKSTILNELKIQLRPHAQGNFYVSQQQIKESAKPSKLSARRNTLTSIGRSCVLSKNQLNSNNLAKDDDLLSSSSDESEYDCILSPKHEPKLSNFGSEVTQVINNATNTNDSKRNHFEYEFYTYSADLDSVEYNEIFEDLDPPKTQSEDRDKLKTDKNDYYLTSTPPQNRLSNHPLASDFLNEHEYEEEKISVESPLSTGDEASEEIYNYYLTSTPPLNPPRVSNFISKKSNVENKTLYDHCRMSFDRTKHEYEEEKSPVSTFLSKVENETLYDYYGIGFDQTEHEYEEEKVTLVSPLSTGHNSEQIYTYSQDVPCSDDVTYEEIKESDTTALVESEDHYTYIDVEKF